MTLEEEVAGAIMRAFFSRPVEEQQINVCLADQLDLARSAIESYKDEEIERLRKQVEKQRADLSRDMLSKNADIERLRTMLDEEIAKSIERRAEIKRLRSEIRRAAESTTDPIMKRHLLALTIGPGN